MEEKTITIKTVEEKKTKTGLSFWAVKDLENKSYSAWDEGIGEVLKSNIGKSLVVGVKTSGEFVNIRAIIGGADEPLKVNTGKVITEYAKPKNSNVQTSIVAQCLTKVFWENSDVKPEAPEDVLGTYNYYLKEL